VPRLITESFGRATTKTEISQVMSLMIKSKAFQLAALKSERYRIVGLLCLLGALMLYAIVRDFLAGELRLLLAQTFVLILVIAYEAIMLLVVQRALKRGAQVPGRIWVLNVLIETQLPTIALLLLIETRFMATAQALVAPAVLLYFLFIILSTLRLSPGLSLLTGIMSALGYLGVVVYGSESLTRTPVAMPLGIYFVYAGLIFAGGCVAAMVAGQIRVHVYAALREAELQRELERVNHDLETARSIQQGLLPTELPGLEDFDVAGWNQPADQTGGDYFDWQTLPDGRLAISLGDATGHGIGPALVTTSCRAYARASFLVGKQEGVLNRLNQLLADDLPSNRFVTYAVVLLDPMTSHVEVLSAGHGPILWYRYAADKIDSLSVQGIPLGMIAGAPYDPGTKGRLEAGDMLVLITDGFYEWENPDGEEFGIARLEAVIRESRDCTPEGVISRLRSSVMSFCRGTKQMDDLTAVILKRKAKP
jgi:serine phosphatase RsbU (regulator of sigma subunit)